MTPLDSLVFGLVVAMKPESAAAPAVVYLDNFPTLSEMMFPKMPKSSVPKDDSPRSLATHPLTEKTALYPQGQNQEKFDHESDTDSLEKTILTEMPKLTLEEETLPDSPKTDQGEEAQTTNDDPTTSQPPEPFQSGPVRQIGTTRTVGQHEQFPSDLLKTKMCKNIGTDGASFCKFGDKCSFAHSQEELRARPEALQAQRKLNALPSPPKGFMVCVPTTEDGIFESNKYAEMIPTLMEHYRFVAEAEQQVLEAFNLKC